MPAITYQNTRTNIPYWVNTVHVEQQRGYAYERNGRFFHIYGRAQDLWTISIGLTATQTASADGLNGWANKTFGAQNTLPMEHEPGEVINAVWRPGLIFQNDIHQALSTNEYSQRVAEQALRILIEKLDDVLLYLEPTPSGLMSYGHKTRELLILACMEVENFWGQYMSIANTASAGRGFSTNDYIKLLRPLHLVEYQVRFKLINGGYSFQPFNSWNSTNPTQSLTWYDAYNKTKHNRELHFSSATLENCLHAISAVITMFCVRHSPFPLISGGSFLSGLFNQHFDIALVGANPASFYVPAINAPVGFRQDLCCGTMAEYVAPWKQNPLVI